jgi:cold shock CspA family protein
MQDETEAREDTEVLPSEANHPEGQEPLPRQPLHRGIVKWYSIQHDVGVIEMEGANVWVYRSTIKDPRRKLSPGDEVEFWVVKTRKGLLAKGVIRIATKTDEEIIARACKMIDEMEW